MSSVKTGDVVRLHLTGRLDDGSVFVSTQGHEPVEMLVQEGRLIEGIRQAVLGMTTGERKTVQVPPALGFGESDPGLQDQVPRSALPDGVQVGERLLVRTPSGESRVWVRHLGEEFAVLDGNHPLAGQSLTFDLELVSVGSTEDKE